MPWTFETFTGADLEKYVDRIRGHAPLGNVLDFNSLSPLFFLWVSESFRQDIGQPFFPDEALQIGGLFHEGQFPDF